ncbi:MAG: hypothetical protein HS111_40465, partial [Kofleriaceae bacterium]|nr:hypothetical protein [Kofleriaceae bacterium]
MRGLPCGLVSAILVVVAACGAADNRVDPGDLSLRDLLGLAPAVGLGWDDDQRAAARAVLADALDQRVAASEPP